MDAKRTHHRLIRNNFPLIYRKLILRCKSELEFVSDFLNKLDFIIFQIDSIRNVKPLDIVSQSITSSFQRTRRNWSQVNARKVEYINYKMSRAIIQLFEMKMWLTHWAFLSLSGDNLAFHYRHILIYIFIFIHMPTTAINSIRKKRENVCTSQRWTS